MANPTTNRHKPAEPVAVCDGRRLIGCIKALRGKRAVAIGADGKSLGEFPNQSEATQVLTGHAVRRDGATP